MGGRKTRADADALRAAQEALAQVALPSPQQLPQQKTGTRASRALPYELHTSARTDLLNGTVKLLFSNTGKQAAVFHVYDRLNLDRVPQRYMVEAGKELDDVWNVNADNGGRYDLWVLGPNGYHRAFTGDLSLQRGAQAQDPEVRVCYEITQGNVEVTLTNNGTAPATLHARAKAYRYDGPWSVTLAAGESKTLSWDLSDSEHWYDFVITCAELPGYSRRFAGRVETGKDGVSDPAMGQQDL